jgi:ubiquitin-protein ligase
LNRLQKDPPAGIAAVPSDDNILIWHAFILGCVENINLKR